MLKKNPDGDRMRSYWKVTVSWDADDANVQREKYAHAGFDLVCPEEGPDYHFPINGMETTDSTYLRSIILRYKCGMTGRRCEVTTYDLHAGNCPIWKGYRYSCM